MVPSSPAPALAQNGGTVIPSALLADIKAEASASPSREICGLLFGSSERIAAAQATPNVAEDPAAGFEVDPAALLAAHKAARGGGPAVIGHYHSHPSGSAAPSDRDRAAAQSGQLWLILAGNEARLWLAENGDFAERQILLS